MKYTSRNLRQVSCFFKKLSGILFILGGLGVIIIFGLVGPIQTLINPDNTGAAYLLIPLGAIISFTIGVLITRLGIYLSL